MLFDQKQNPPRAIIRAAATPVNEEGQSTVPAHPWRRQPDQTTVQAQLISGRIRGNGQLCAGDSLGPAVPTSWQTGPEEVTALALQASGLSGS